MIQIFLMQKNNILLKSCMGFLLYTTCLITSCLPAIKENESDDKTHGAELIKGFYEAIAKQDTSKLNHLMIDPVKADVFGPNGINGVIKNKELKFGRFKEYKILEDLTVRVDVANVRCSIDIKYLFPMENQI
ncbi:hypothetical protein [Pedobacter sp. BMA]|uniref:hypothetical protein n=1 Tax=Pedobacter sp. BMA TaxID=1663685 RepID=UPI000658E600|nr:hypothetical protein [Pedobacter sp. BMA]KLT65390.1 hypothetical protein AB669_09870 [Pedobacter sp. BMA]